MASKKRSLKNIVALVHKNGGIRAAARASTIPYSTLRDLYAKAVDEGYSNKMPESGDAAKAIGKDQSEPIVNGRIEYRPTIDRPLPKGDDVTRYILTAAQNNTRIHEGTWKNLNALADYFDAELMVSRFTYDKGSYREGNVKPGTTAPQPKMDPMVGIDTAHEDDYSDVWYDARLEPYFQDDRIRLAPSLIWCGEMNILPTAVRPLSGFENYTGGSSGIFPHVKFAMESVPSGKTEQTKINYTTGTVTTRNYIQKKAGLKAEFHHCFHPDTTFLTVDGVKSLSDTIGTIQTIWDGVGWASAEVKSFGEQQLYAISLAPCRKGHRSGTKYRKIVKATVDHTWILQNGTTTNRLSVGNIVKGAKPTIEYSSVEYDEGMRHGMIFGDGSQCYRAVDGQYSFQIPLHGENISQHKHLFEHITHWKSRENIDNYTGTAYYKSYDDFKDIPYGKSPAYISGFLNGWVSADAVFHDYGSIELASINEDALNWAKEVAPYAGWTVTGECVYGNKETNFGKRSFPLRRITFTKDEIDWVVTNITLAEKSEVMCTVVESNHQFTLAGGVLTGNCYGSVIAEVNSEGNWWVRQLNADSEGTIYDLTLRVHDGKVTDGHSVTAASWGDIHEADIEPSVQESTWLAEDSICSVLKPETQFSHDTIDFRYRNHHDVGNPHIAFDKFVNNKDSVESEVGSACEWLVARSIEAEEWGGKIVVVDSNHDNAMMRWLREGNYRNDPVNALFFLRLQTAVYEAIARNEYNGFHLFEWVFEEYFGYGSKHDIQFLRTDESYIICDNASPGSGIECGMHGHLGPNGSRGSINNLAKTGHKANVGHSHTAGIRDGVYQAGTSSKLDLGYNKGPSSWSHSHIIVYPNGKRTIVTICNGKWRA